MRYNSGPVSFWHYSYQMVTSRYFFTVFPRPKGHGYYTFLRLAIAAARLHDKATSKWYFKFSRSRFIHLICLTQSYSALANKVNKESLQEHKLPTVNGITSAAEYWKNQFSEVHVAGEVFQDNAFTPGQNIALGTIPAGFRPRAEKRRPVTVRATGTTSAYPATISIDTDGNIKMDMPIGATGVRIVSMEFSYLA